MECLNNLQAEEGVDIAVTGIHGLLVSIIYRSYLDLCSHEKQVKREAEFFFKSQDVFGPYGFTFLQIMDELDLDPARILKAVKEKSPDFKDPLASKGPRKLCRFRAFSGRSSLRPSNRR